MTRTLTGQQKTAAEAVLRAGSNDAGAARRLLLLAAVLILLVIVSAVAVVYSSYKSRQLFAELQRLDRDAIRLEEQWGRLLLEQSTWASHVRVEHLARSELQMVVPDSSNIVVVER